MSESNLEEGSNSNNQVFKDAENQIKEVCEVLQREATRLRQEQEAIDAMTKKIDHVHLTSTINLNIGGRRRLPLSKAETTFLEASRKIHGTVSI